MEKIYTKIVGVTFENEDGSSRQDIISLLSPGERLHLEDMASVEYPEAIGVFTRDSEQCGFISSDLAEDLRRKVPNFTSLVVTVEDVTGGYGSNWGCNISLSSLATKPVTPSEKAVSPAKSATKAASKSVSAPSKQSESSGCLGTFLTLGALILLVFYLFRIS